MYAILDAARDGSLTLSRIEDGTLDDAIEWARLLVSEGGYGLVVPLAAFTWPSVDVVVDDGPVPEEA